jgi:dolichol kinase
MSPTGDRPVSDPYRCRRGTVCDETETARLIHVTAPENAAASTSAQLDTLVERTRGLQPLRRAFHAGNGIAMALAPTTLGLSRVQTAWVFGGIVILLAIGDAARLRAPRLNILFFKSFPSLASPREAASFASSTWYALGIFLTWILFPPAVAVPAILVLALADPCASIVGRLTRGRPLGKGSVPGSAAFFAVASVVLMTTVGHPLVLAVAALVAVVEIAPWRVDDNLTIPLSAAFLLWVVSP